MSDNRRSGHNWERKLVKILSDAFSVKFMTSRSESKRMDDLGIDFVTADRSFPIDFQAKEQTLPKGSKSYSIKIEALGNMQTDKQRALLVRLWRKGESKRKLQGHYMVVDLEFGMELLKTYYHARNKPIQSTGTSPDLQDHGEAE